MTVLKQQSPSEATWWHKVQHHNQVPLFSHTHTPSATNQQQHTHRAATRPPSHNKVKHQPPCFCHHTHTQAVDQQGSHTKRHMVMVMVASVEPHHKPVVSHGSSHVVFCLATTHSQVAHTRTHTRDSGRRCGGKHGVDETTHTPHHEHHALKPKWQAHTMPSQWLSQSMVHCALACVCGQATCCTHTHTHTRASGGTTEAKQPTLKPPPTTTTPTPIKQASWWSLTHRLVTHTHTRGKQDKGHSKTKAVVAMACTVTMPWHKRATPVVMPPWLVHQVHAPPMQVATSTHPLSHHTHTRGREKRSWERGHKEWRGTVA